MKTKKNLWSSVSILIVAVLAITAFIRGTWQFWLLISAFAIWSIWAIIKHLIPFAKECKAQKEAKAFQKYFEKQEQARKAFQQIEDGNPLSPILLRHINHRISAQLQAIYPDATWDWQEVDPIKLATNGGIGRIQINGVSDFNFAEVVLDQNAKVECRFLKIVPFADNREPIAEESDNHAKPKEIDPQVWYEKKGKIVLQNLIVDLNSRGHKSLTICDDGNIILRQSDNKELKKSAFQNLPERVYWPKLVKIFERDGMATEITDLGLVLTW
jgi:hypothetical protein